MDIGKKLASTYPNEIAISRVSDSVFQFNVVYHEIQLPCHCGTILNQIQAGLLTSNVFIQHDTGKLQPRAEGQ